MELELVEELGRVAPGEVEVERRSLGGELLRPAEVETAREPDGVVDEALEEGGPAFAHGGVAEAPVLDGERGADVREVLGVACLVEERAPVVGSAHRLDDEHDAAGHLDRRAEGARRLQRAALDVELDVLLASAGRSRDR